MSQLENTFVSIPLKCHSRESNDGIKKKELKRVSVCKMMVNLEMGDDPRSTRLINHLKVPNHHALLWKQLVRSFVRWNVIIPPTFWTSSSRICEIPHQRGTCIKASKFRAWLAFVGVYCNPEMRKLRGARNRSPGENWMNSRWFGSIITMQAGSTVVEFVQKQS